MREAYKTVRNTLVVLTLLLIVARCTDRISYAAEQPQPIKSETCEKPKPVTLPAMIDGVCHVYTFKERPKFGPRQMICTLRDHTQFEVFIPSGKA